MEEINPIKFGMVRPKKLANWISKLSTDNWIEPIIVDKKRFEDSLNFWKDKPETSFWRFLEN